MSIKEGPNYKCPAYGGRCKKHRDNCPEYIHITGKDPQTDEIVNMFDCSRRWVPTLLLEISQRLNQQGAGIESFRNEMVKTQTNFNGILASATNALIASNEEAKKIESKPTFEVSTNGNKNKCDS